MSLRFWLVVPKFQFHCGPINVNEPPGHRSQSSDTGICGHVPNATLISSNFLIIWTGAFCACLITSCFVGLVWLTLCFGFYRELVVVDKSNVDVSRFGNNGLFVHAELCNRTLDFNCDIVPESITSWYEVAVRVCVHTKCLWSFCW